MSLSLADLLADRRTITLTYLGHEVSVTYKPAAYTVEVANVGLGYPEFVVALVAEWDVLDGDTPLPIDLEHVSALPFPFLKAVATAVQEDVRLGEAERP